MTRSTHLAHQPDIIPIPKAAGLAVLATALLFLVISAFAALSPGSPQIDYTCNPEQPHRSVKECVR